MKDRLPVLKSEAKRITYLPECICNKEYVLSIRIGTFRFVPVDFYTLYSSNEYKNYEWVLTPISELTQGQIIKTEYKNIGVKNICVFDKLTTCYFEDNEKREMCALVWYIEDNRPKKDTPTDKVYKLFKKVD